MEHIDRQGHLTGSLAQHSLAAADWLLRLSANSGATVVILTHQNTGSICTCSENTVLSGV